MIEVISILDQDDFGGVIGLVDADFDHIEGRSFDLPNVITTNLHDLECVQLNSDSFDSLISEFGSQRKLSAFGRDVQETILESARLIGCLRLFSERNRLNLKFRDLNYSKVLDTTYLTVDLDTLVEAIKRRSNRRDLTNLELIRGINDLKKMRHDPWQICSGSDLLRILSFGLRSRLGTNNVNSVDNTQLRQALRLSFSGELFDRSEIKRHLLSWEKRNFEYRIF